MKARHLALNRFSRTDGESSRVIEGSGFDNHALEWHALLHTNVVWSTASCFSLRPMANPETCEVPVRRISSSANGAASSSAWGGAPEY